MIRTSNKITVLIFSIIVTGCMSTGTGNPSSDDSVDRIIDQTSYILNQSSRKDIVILEVPSPENIISEKMTVSALELGARSTAVDYLVKLLAKDNDAVIGVVGRSPRLNKATVKSALKGLVNRSSSGTIYFITDTLYADDLLDIATKVNVTLIPVRSTQNLK
ncbi:MAG: hypothetical protein ABW146_19060 [Candidatus Sedimenticola sp. 6PFRAG7]